MGKQTAISWTQHTFNPWWGCTKVSEGCRNCYAETFAQNRAGFNGKTHPEIWGPGKARRTFGDKHWAEPLKWNAEAEASGRRRLVFCASMADVFDAEAPAGQLERLWAVIRATPMLNWQLLTKRPERIIASLPQDWGEGYSNVWLGTSVENQAAADVRVPELRAVPARVRFLSCEPLLGPLNLGAFHRDWFLNEDPRDADTRGPRGELLGPIHWVIAGGESGTGCRRMEPDWLRSVRDQCSKAGVAFLFKQWGGRLPGGQAELDGREHHAFPRCCEDCGAGGSTRFRHPYLANAHITLCRDCQEKGWDGNPPCLEVDCPECGGSGGWDDGCETCEGSGGIEA